MLPRRDGAVCCNFHVERRFPADVSSVTGHGHCRWIVAACGGAGGGALAIRRESITRYFDFSTGAPRFPGEAAPVLAGALSALAPGDGPGTPRSSTPARWHARVAAGWALDPAASAGLGLDHWPPVAGAAGTPPRSWAAAFLTLEAAQPPARSRSVRLPAGKAVPPRWLLPAASACGIVSACCSAVAPSSRNGAGLPRRPDRWAVASAGPDTRWAAAAGGGLVALLLLGPLAIATGWRSAPARIRPGGPSPAIWPPWGTQSSGWRIRPRA